MLKKDLELAHMKMAMMATTNQGTLREAITGILQEDAEKMSETVLGLLQNSSSFTEMILTVSDPKEKDPKNRPLEMLFDTVWQDLRTAAKLAEDPNADAFQMYSAMTAALNRMRTFLHMFQSMNVAMTLSSMVTFKENLPSGDSGEFEQMISDADPEDQDTVDKVDKWINDKVSQHQN
jgi:hypothetical protein